MYKRDLISAEIEKLNQVLARIMGMKLEGRLTEAAEIFDETLAKNFQLPKPIIQNPDLSDFENWLSHTDLPAEKLDTLSEFLYYELGLNPQRNKLIAAKLNLVYKVLADKFKTVHLTNFHRQEILQQYL